MEETIIYRWLHIPTGLFYCTVKGRYTDDKTNLSEKGNIYLSEKLASKADLNSAHINKAQAHRFKIQGNDGRWSFAKAKKEEFRLVKYSLTEITD